MNPVLSVVVPVYGCAPCLHALYDRVTKTLEELVPAHEIVLVDDRAEDGTWDIICGLGAADDRVRGVRLSRNFGQHAAITAGLAQARGEWVVVMDCDLQEPPEAIPQLWEAALQGYDIVLGQRRETRLAWHRRVGSRTYYRLLRMFTGLPFDGSVGNFSLISRKVVDSFLRFRDQDRDYLFILHWLGYERTLVQFEHRSRHAGRSSYTLRKLLSHALDGVFFQTTVFLRWVVRFGFMMATIGVLLAAYFVMSKLTGSSYPGWTSLAVFTLTIGGFIIISTGITGIYVGKVFDQVKDRPLFVVDKVSWDAHAPLPAPPSEETPATPVL